MSDIDKFHEWVETQSPLALREYMFAQAAWQARGELDAVRIKKLEVEVKTWQEIANRYVKYEEMADVKIEELTAKLDKAKDALKWIDKVNAMDYEYVKVARQALEELDK